VTRTRVRLEREAALAAEHQRLAREVRVRAEVLERIRFGVAEAACFLHRLGERDARLHARQHVRERTGEQAVEGEHALAAQAQVAQGAQHRDRGATLVS
jgi:hypothetical protein